MLFGPAGNSELFYEEGNKASVQMPKWLNKMGLTAYEYQCSRGVRISEALAKEIGQQAEEYGITLSIHAPYYINLSTTEEKIKDSSIGHIMKSLYVARWMGAKTIVFHPGAAAKIDRGEALKRAKELLNLILLLAQKEGFSDIKLAPETMGKKNQLGSLDEVLELCQISKQLVPCIDFGHLHAVNEGSLNDKEAFAKVLDRIQEVLNDERGKKFHVHFSPIEFTAGGEKKHWRFKDTQFGPSFLPLSELAAERELDLTVICESAGTQAEDAKTMMEMYQKAKTNC